MYLIVNWNANVYQFLTPIGKFVETIRWVRSYILSLSVVPKCSHWIVDNFIFRRLKHAVDGCGDLHDPQIGGQMPSCEGQAPDEEKTDLCAEISQLFLGELSHIMG